MRATIQMLLFTTLGMIAMTATESDVDAGQEKKDGPKAPFNQRVTLRYSSDGVEFLKPLKEVDAYQYEGKRDKKPYFGVRSGGKNSMAGSGGKLPPGSEIIDKDGVTWVVTRQVNDAAIDNTRHFEVKKKDEPKKE